MRTAALPSVRRLVFSQVAAQPAWSRATHWRPVPIGAVPDGEVFPTIPFFEDGRLPTEGQGASPADARPSVALPSAPELEQSLGTDVDPFALASEEDAKWLEEVPCRRAV